MAGHDHGRRRTGRRRGVITAGAVAAAAVAVASVAWPISGSLAASHASGASHVRPAAARAAIPAGWAAVPYRRGQLAVPGQWMVETSQLIVCPTKTSGMIFAGIKPRIPKSADCSLTARYAWIIRAGHIPAGISHRKPTAVINGIRVYRLPSGKNSVLYLVPELGVRVGAHGPLTKRVLATLTRSPLAVVLASGPASRVPAHWVRHQFGGVRFAVPRAWSLHHETQWATCGTGLVPRWLLLINAKKRPAALPCPFPFPSAVAIEAKPGLTAVTGKYAAVSVSEKFTRCLLRQGTKICLASITGQGGLSGGVLIFSVARPHHKPAFFVLGLSGSGAQARAIFDSMTVH